MDHGTCINESCSFTNQIFTLVHNKKAFVCKLVDSLLIYYISKAATQLSSNSLHGGWKSCYIARILVIKNQLNKFPMSALEHSKN